MSALGLCLHTPGLSANQGASQEPRSCRFVDPGAEQLLLALVRRAHGPNPLCKRQPLGGKLGNGPPARAVLHFHLRQPAQTAWGRSAAERT